MSRDPNEIRLKEGEIIAYTFTVYRDGSAEDLSAATVTFFLKDDEAAKGTNRIDAGGTSWVTDGSDGKFTYTFTNADTTITTGKDVKGKYGAKITSGGGTVREYTDFETVVIERNPFVA